MKRYSAVVVGCGPRGRDHAKGFLQYPDRYELKGLCDQSKERLDGVCAELKTGNEVGKFSDAEAMLKEIKPDIFCFATLPGIRYPLVELGVKHGAKLIAFEKPMALSLTEARKIHELCAKNGVKYTNAHLHKYAGHWKKTKELADTGQLGRVKFIHATAKGWLLQYGTHLIDYMLWLNGGSRVKKVAGHVSGRGKLSDSHPSPDYAQARLVFENGVEGLIECGTLAPSYSSAPSEFPGEMQFWLDAGATVLGTEGFAQTIVGGGWRACTKKYGASHSAEVKFRQTEDTFEYVRDLAEWLDDPDMVHPCGNDITYHGFEVCHAICQSALERSVIDLPLAQSAEPDVMTKLKQMLPE